MEQILPPSGLEKEEKWQLDGLLPSPSHRAVVFRRGEEDGLWLYDVENRSEKFLISLGRAASGDFAAVMTTAVMWSTDEKRLLVYVSAVQEMQADGAYAPKAPPAEYGYHFYDLTTGRHTPLPEGLDVGRAEVWLSNGDFIVTTGPGAWDKSSNGEGGKLLQVSSTGKYSPLVLARLPPGSEFHQVTASPDEQWLAFNVLNWKDNTSRIQKLNLKTKTLDSITPVGDFAEFQFAKFSPSGARLAYRHMSWRGGGVVIDGVTVYPAVGPPPHPQWIDDMRFVMVLASKHEGRRVVAVADASSGKILTEHEIENR